MYKLSSSSACVVGGELYSEVGTLLKKPGMLVYGGVLVRVGEYNDLIKDMLAYEGCYLFDLTKYPDKYFSVNDICYTIRRCSELLDDEFVREFVERYGSVGFLEWFDKEKETIRIQTSVDCEDGLKG